MPTPAMGDTPPPSLPPDDELSPSELHVVRVVIVSFLSLSLLGSLFILWHYVRAFRAARSMSHTMVVLLAAIDLAHSFPKLLGMPSNVRGPACDAQGFFLILTGLMTVIWNCCLAHSMYRKAVHRDSETRLRAKLKLYLVLTIVPALVGSICLLAGDMYGPAQFYCQVGDRKYYFVSFYLWVMLALVYVCVVLLITHVHIARRAQEQNNLDALESSLRINLKLRIYIIAFVVLWSPSAIYRVFGDQMGSASFPLAIAMQVTLCSQGVATAMIYGGLLTKLRSLCARQPRHVTYKAIAPPIFYSGFNGNDSEDGANSEQLQKRCGKPASLFVSTFNMGEGKLSKAELLKWIPRGYDIYVIGVQECLHLSDTRKLIRQHLEGHLTPTGEAIVPFRQFRRQIGSTNTSLGYHGHIAITVFIKAEDVESGAFYMPPAGQQEIHCGKSLVVARASNKGAVGFAFRYFDTSFAFATCHLSSDSKGKSKVMRRNRDAVDMLQGLNLNAEDVGFEFPLMHHHSFVLGDLNYRLTHRGAGPSDILELVGNIHRSEMQANNASDVHGGGSIRSRKQWSWASGFLSDSSSFLRNASRGASLRVDTTESNLDVHMLERSNHDNDEYSDSRFNMATTTKSGEIASCGSGDDNARYANGNGLLTHTSLLDLELADDDDDKYIWEDLLAHDELTNWMRASQIFFGFREAKITFPPSYRRKRGAALKLDATKWSAQELSKQFTTSVKGQGERVPSFTDRILFASQEDMRSRLHCSLYTSCEDVKCSDHKPVVAVFHALVNRTHLPIFQHQKHIQKKHKDKKNAARLQRTPHLRGVFECTLQIEFDAVRWHVHPALLPNNEPTKYSDSNGEIDDPTRRLDQANVTVVFPLPSEDIFSEQRTLHELADSLSGGALINLDARTPSQQQHHTPLRMSSSLDVPFHSNVAHVRWPEFVRDGLTHATLARVIRTNSMHAALKVHLGNGGGGVPCLGQGVIAIPPTCLEGVNEKSAFEIELSVGGKATGTLSGRVSVGLAQRATEMGSDNNDNDEGEEDGKDDAQVTHRE
ncbi:Phosphatidylinositol 3, partial [Globisporangium splendens]